MIEDAWRLLSSTNEWVRFADTKAAGSLAGAGVLGGVIAQAGLQGGASGGSEVAVGLAIAAGAAAAMAAGLALYALIPSLRIGEPASLIYFEHVARRYKKDQVGHAYEVKQLLIDDDRLFEEVAAQIWANSVVAREKFVCSAWALVVLGLGILLGGAAAGFAIL